MTRHDDGWQRVADRFETLGEDLRGHFETTTGETAFPALERAVRQLTTAVERGLSGIADSVRDPKLRKDTVEVATAFQEAVTKSLSDVQARMSRRRVAPPAAPPTAPPAVHRTAAPTTAPPPKATRTRKPTAVD